MLIFFLRHANAGQRKLDPARDQKRPLDDEGIEQCRYVGRLLSSMDTHVDLIVSSPLKRATQTASLVGNEIGYESRLLLDSALKPSATYEQFQAMLRNFVRHDAVMLVGHSPNLTRFLSLLVTHGANANAVEMKKGSVARVEVDARRAQLNWLITPKMAKAAYLSSGKAKPLQPVKVKQLKQREELPVARRVGKAASRGKA